MIAMVSAFSRLGHPTWATGARSGQPERRSDQRANWPLGQKGHAYAVALHMMYYNFVRIHSTLRMTPAMAAGVSDRLWEIGDIVNLVEDAEAGPGKRGSYKKQNAN